MERGNQKTYTRINNDGMPDASGKYILLGSYPQSRVKNENLVSMLNEMSGELPTNGNNNSWISYKYYIFDSDEEDFMWYQDILHDGVKYRGVYFTDYRPNDTMNTSEENCQASNGYHPCTVYWFEYDPVKWRILDEREGKAWLISDLCIDSQAYRNVVWENSYVKSSIRKWLNSEFLHTAFCKCETEAISRKIIVNNMEDEDVCDGDKPGSDTFDLIHLLSVDEASELMTYDELKSIATDYALCQGIRVNTQKGISFWWLRSPYYSIESWAQIVCANDLCAFNTSDIGNTDTGIRPALWLKL